MSTTTRGEPAPLQAVQSTGRGEGVRKALLACGALSGLVYIRWHEIAALQREAYSRVSNAISELELTGSPSKWVLDPWHGIVYNALVIAFGIGVWRSAQDIRALRVSARQPTPFIGLYERIAFGAYFLWRFVLVALLWRRRAN